ncbi:DNA-binding MarR family transcriptional regulator [Erythromicrobium ramosum]|jgi:DNA-binding MarR family transcriptional regulator|uniref:MarR family transcriptional regulator n=1 Tax=Erythrobacter ramosus TaxID=35811 RepID=A0A6I4UML8_9SPHN|nr:MarR family transcriptional regulator [Erythrobacter ramosus]MBB3776353.1 DNA-binding MarR family transcriptional regulator [Erythrobacter ramosus]MXP38565.1 MarR family transcriptional regulator [Erythrobacter ramosus]
MNPLDLTMRWQRHAALLFSFSSFAGRRMKIGLAEVAVLEQLAVAGEMSLGAIGNFLSMPSASMTLLIDRLEGKHMVRRRPNPQDRRGILVSLTDVAMEKAGLDLVPAAEAMTAAAADLTPAERAIVARYFDAVDRCLTDQKASGSK